MQYPGWAGRFTALMAAAEKGHTEIAKLLVNAGADVNQAGTVS